MKRHPNLDYRPTITFGFREATTAAGLSIVASALALAGICLVGAFLPALGRVLGP